jgi:hypothetical protein
MVGRAFAYPVVTPKPHAGICAGREWVAAPSTATAVQDVKHMRSVVRTLLRADGHRKVEVYQRPDGTYGFEELCFGEEEQAWFPCVRHSVCFADTVDRAVEEAEGRVSWLRDNLTTDAEMV